MRLRYYFILLAVLQLSVWVVLLVLGVERQSVIFYVIEGMTLLNIVGLVVFYRKVMKPIDSITTGLDLLKDQDFNSIISKQGHYEADKIVEIFNTMLMQLRSERIKSVEQNHFLNLLIECSPMGVVIMDGDNRISSANASAKKMLENENLVGAKLNEINVQLSHEMMKLGMNEARTVRTRGANIYKCSLHSFVNNGVPHNFYLMESLTDEMIRAEKNAYEKVIRIMAHEVNNTVAGVSSAIDSVSQLLEAEDLRDMMQVCVERNNKMSSFITNLSNVVKIPEPMLQIIDLNIVVERCSLFFQTFCNSNNVRLHVRCSDEENKVRVDVSLFEQALQNIIKNSVESIGNDGDVYISVQRVNECVTLEIADNGKGISAEVESNLFSPFYTTKPGGQGVGLMFIREVLVRHKCTFSLRTCEDGLTRFIIKFP